MARRQASLKIRFLILGIFITFLVSSYWGISLVQDGNFLSRKCPEQFEKEYETEEEYWNIPKGEHTLCILVPFRDRFEELLEFAPHMNGFLTKQGVDFKLIVINQLDRYRFNRASLINVGFLETRSQCDYIAMHDVDLLPMNDDLSYDFPERGPVHLAAPHLHPIYHYKTFVGGILLLQSKHFEMVNGLSNKYWGWGREDDEFFVRMKKAKLTLGRPGNLTTGYKTFKHVHDRRKRRRDQMNIFDQREKTRRLDKETGVVNVKYTVDSENHLNIDGALVTILNVYLECDVDFTPWCLQTDDHDQYYKRLEKKTKELEQNQQQQQPLEQVQPQKQQSQLPQHQRQIPQQLQPQMGKGQLQNQNSENQLQKSSINKDELLPQHPPPPPQR